MKKKQTILTTILVASVVVAVLILPAAAEHEEAFNTWLDCETDCDDEFNAWLNADDTHNGVGGTTQTPLDAYLECVQGAEDDYHKVIDPIIDSLITADGPASDRFISLSTIPALVAGDKLQYTTSVCNTLYLGLG